VSDRRLHWSPSYTTRLILVGVAYYVAARLSLRAALVGGVVTPIWPPTGIAFVALLVLGYRVWPAITAGALAVNLPINDTVAGAVLIAAGNTIAPILAVRLLHMAGFRRELDRLVDALLVVMLGALTAMTISASFGATALLLSGTINSRAFTNTWSVWWAGDATGILVFAPFLLSLGTLRRTWRLWWPWRSLLEAVVLFAALAAVAHVVFRSQFEYAYLVFPFLIWAAIRFGQFGASMSTLVVVLMAVWAAVDEAGPFAHETLLHRMLTLQVYNAVTALTSFVLAAIMTERTRALADVRAGFEREHRITETLQRSLLPERMPEIPGVALASRYLPGSAGLDVGGDWYDVFLLPNGRVALTIGDVVGRGVASAAAMGQLRTALRAYALDAGSPGAVVERLSRLVHEFESAQMATLVYAVLDPDTGQLTFASAGHPPPLLVGPGATARFLDDGRSPPLGVWQGTVRDATVTMEPGATLLLYTDGLVESRTESIEQSLEAFRRSVLDHDGDLDALCDDRILRSPRPQASDDDVALLALRLMPMATDALKLVYPAEPHVVASVRRAVSRWLGKVGATDEEIHDIVLGCDEAATNVLEHAYGPGGGPLEVDATNADGTISIIVRDHGTWRPPREDGRGRGFVLMEAVSDSVDVVHTAHGTEVHLRRRLGHERAAERAVSEARRASEPAAGELSVAVTHLTGDIDLATAPARYQELITAVSNDDVGLVVDLSGVQYLDSAGIRLLYQVAARLAARRQQLRVVVPPSSPLRRILRLSELESSVTVVATVEDAVGEIRGAVNAAG
jgi:anti-anti-sigma factor